MLCQLCNREEAHNFHHLIPRTLHSNKWFKKRYTRDELRQGIDLCKACHRAVHDLVPDEKELGRDYNTLERLRRHPKIDKYLRWKRTKARAGKEADERLHLAPADSQQSPSPPAASGGTV